LHAVDPNSLTRTAFTEPQRGQATLRSGGAMPWRRSFSRPCAEIQSLVHGGDNLRSIATFATPCRSSASITSCSITSVAGHPE
jgi:hypothetical protein